jgi:hypothetical protein
MAPGVEREIQRRFHLPRLDLSSQGFPYRYRSLLSNKGPLSTEGLFWTVQKNPPDDYANGEEHSLEIRYHSLDNNVTVGKETFNLSGGNLFVIRLDENWTPTVSQVSGRLTERATPDKVLKFFKSILRHDEIIQRLELSE